MLSFLQKESSLLFIISIFWRLFEGNWSLCNSPVIIRDVFGFFSSMNLAVAVILSIMSAGLSLSMLLVLQWITTSLGLSGKVPFLILQNKFSILSPPKPKLSVLSYKNLFQTSGYLRRPFAMESPTRSRFALYMEAVLRNLSCNAIQSGLLKWGEGFMAIYRPTH